MPNEMIQFPVTLDMYQVVVGFLLPAAIAVIVQCQYSKKLKALLAVACVVAAAGIHLFFAGAFDLSDLPGSLLKIGYLSGTSYLIFLRPLGITDWIEQHVNSGKEASCDPVK